MSKDPLLIRGGFVTTTVNTRRTKVKFPNKRNPLRRFAKLMGKKSPQQLYTESLEQTIETLQTQIQTLREESRQLRNLLTKQHSKKRSSVAAQVQSIQNTEQILRNQIAQFEIQIQELEESKQELIQLLEQERETIAQQEEMIRMQKVTIQKAEENFKNEMDHMRASLLKESKVRMEELAKSTDFKVQQDSMAKQKWMEEMIEKERRKGIEDVEKEKDKMRKLVKALAEKEKRGKLNDLKAAEKLEQLKNINYARREAQKAHRQDRNRKKILATGGSSKSFSGKTKRAVFGAKSLKTE